MVLDGQSLNRQLPQEVRVWTELLALDQHGVMQLRRIGFWKSESGTNRGRLRGQSFRIGNNVSEVREPPVEVLGQIVVQDSGADLEQEVSAAGTPAHLLILHHPFAHDLVDGRLHERAGDGLACSVSLPVVGDGRGIGPDVGVELGDRLEQLALFGARVLDVEVNHQILDDLQGSKDVAVP